MSTTTASNGHVPTGPRRGGYSRRGGGRQGGGGGGAGNAAQVFADDTDETRALRQKYGDKLGLLKELFADWSDEDLLSVLSQSGGEIELAVGRISEGHAEQFSSVKSKNARKKETSAPAISGSNGASAPAALAGRHASRGSGHASSDISTRGSRGGSAGRGARGGSRGGMRGGGRGGGPAPQSNGHLATSSTDDFPTATAPTSTGPSWAQAIAAAQKKPPTATAAPTVLEEVAEGAAQSAPEAVVSEAAAPAIESASWDDDVPEQPVAVVVEKDDAKGEADRKACRATEA
ncbi:Ubiquitin system component Cue [Ceraceosorus bombacis]|uniref:RNA polymerase II degradation factor 1 n=1 Tax=Ceraceosorus bombacis TaxID=401625 RepID=A0A0P1BBL6_9BASI|nr:Ubiquitin system component Cue [Ceraceosorus bombacis]